MGEDQPRRPLFEYGRNKAAIEEYLLEQAQHDGFPAPVIHSGHISGPGWAPINPVRNVDSSVFQTLANGDKLTLPNLGMETLQHVHADDVAQVVTKALASRSAAVGECVNAVSDTALTLRGYRPRYSIPDVTVEAVNWLVTYGTIASAASRTGGLPIRQHSLPEPRERVNFGPEPIRTSEEQPMHSHDNSQPTPEEYWEQRYSGQDRMWSGKPNPVLVDVAGSLKPGTALDLGCGEGADSVWLAERGWRVTAVDIAATALRRTAERARVAGVADMITGERHDLAETFPNGGFDLVSAQFLQSPLEFPRVEVLRRAARALRPSGLLLIVDHGAPPPWSEHAHEDHRFPTSAEVLDGLELDGDEWRTRRCDQAERVATGPNGQTGALIDNVIAVRRAA